MGSLLQDIFFCLTASRPERELNQQLRARGLKEATRELIQEINALLPSASIATTFVLRELQFGAQDKTLPASFLKTCGFAPRSYAKLPSLLPEEQAILTKIDEKIDALIGYLRHDQEIQEVSIALIDQVMKQWSIGRYNPNPTPQENQQEPKQEPKRDTQPTPTQKAQEEPKKETQPTSEASEVDQRSASTIPKIPQEESDTIHYDKRAVYDLMEEYSDIISPIIIGTPPATQEEEQRIRLFKEHITQAAIEGISPHAIVLSCFYEHTPPHDQLLPPPLEAMNQEAINFLLSILESFNKQGFSPTFMAYMQEHRTLLESIIKNASSNQS